MSDETLAAHLARARACRSHDGMREHAARIAKLPRKRTVKPCNCGGTDKHRSTCPVYHREYDRKRKEQQG